VLSHYVSLISHGYFNSGTAVLFLVVDESWNLLLASAAEVLVVLLDQE
jgi:hypothetical protein